MMVRWPWWKPKPDVQVEDALRCDLLGPVTPKRITDARSQLFELRGVLGWSTYLILDSALTQYEAAQEGE